MNDDMPWVNLTQEEVETLRQSKKELTDYGKQKLKEMINKYTPNYIPDDDVIEEMLQVKLTEEKKEELERMRRKENILQRYNHYHNLETSGLAWGIITPEQQQAIALQSMVDAMKCEHLNQEYNAIEITDIENLIEGLYQQSNEFLNREKDEIVIDTSTKPASTEQSIGRMERK